MVIYGNVELLRIDQPSCPEKESAVTQSRWLHSASLRSPAAYQLPFLPSVEHLDQNWYNTLQFSFCTLQSSIDCYRLFIFTRNWFSASVMEYGSKHWDRIKSFDLTYRSMGQHFQNLRLNQKIGALVSSGNATLKKEVLELKVSSIGAVYSTRASFHLQFHNILYTRFLCSLHCRSTTFIKFIYNKKEQTWLYCFSFQLS